MTVAELMEHIASVERERAARAEQSSAKRSKSLYNSWEWKKARYSFIRNRERKCACCGATPAQDDRIVVDHIKPIRKFWHLRTDPNNLQILCDSCNRAKASYDETRWLRENDQ